MQENAQECEGSQSYKNVLWVTAGLYTPHFRDYLSRSLGYRQQNETPCKKQLDP